MTKAAVDPKQARPLPLPEYLVIGRPFFHHVGAQRLPQRCVAGGVHREPAFKPVVPICECGTPLPPVIVGKPHGEVTERATDRDVADGDGRSF